MCPESWPDQTQAYFWPAVNKRLTRLWPEYFLTEPGAFFWLKGKKIGKFGIFRGNFPSPNLSQRWLTRPEQQKIDPTRVKNIGPRPITNLHQSLYSILKLPFFDRQPEQKRKHINIYKTITSVPSGRLEGGIVKKQYNKKCWCAIKNCSLPHKNP